jgi:hypothetical protein
MLFDKKPELKSMNSDVHLFKEFQTHEDFAHRLGFLRTDAKQKNANIAHLRSHESEKDETPNKSANNESPCLQLGNGHVNHYREILERHLRH